MQASCRGGCFAAVMKKSRRSNENEQGCEEEKQKNVEKDEEDIGDFVLGVRSCDSGDSGG